MMPPQIRVRTVQPIPVDLAGTYKWTTGTRDDYIREEYKRYWSADIPGDMLVAIRKAAGDPGWYGYWDTDDLDPIIHNPAYDPNKSKGVAFQESEAKKRQEIADAARKKAEEEAQTRFDELAAAAQAQIEEQQKSAAAALAAGMSATAKWKWVALGIGVLALGTGAYYLTRKK